MRKLYLNTGELETIFENLRDILQGTLTSDHNQYKLVFKSKNGKGTITGTSFTQELAYLDFDIEFNDDVILSMESSANSPILFTYCMQGNLEHSFGINGNKERLRANQSGILRNSSTINSVLFFKAYERVTFSVISSKVSNKEEVVNPDWCSELQSMFTNPEGNYTYVGELNVKIAEKLQELKNVPQKGIIGSLLKKRIVENILETEVTLHSYGYMQAIKPIMRLANKQVDDLRKIANINFLEIFNGLGWAGRQYVPRFFRGKSNIAYSFQQSKTS